MDALRTLLNFVPTVALLALPAPALPGGDDPGNPYDPSWGHQQPTEVLSFEPNPALPDNQNGFNLRLAIYGLQPGQRLEVGDGVYEVNPFFNIFLQGTPEQPIWIVAKPGARPILTRKDAAQNVLNIGALSDLPARYVCLQGFEVTGGSAGVRLHDASQVWIDGNYIHDVGEAGLTANTANTNSLHVTRNEIAFTAGQGEGMYLGGNDASVIMSNSIIALNHVHHTAGVQGDGIEVKQGSWGNWIVENLVHNTQDPCIIVYGTDGNPINVIERNVMFISMDNVLQVQGEADVLNNLIMNANVNGFFSFDQQGLTRDLRFLHNTILTNGTGARLVDWDGREGMMLGNNVIYSQFGPAVEFDNGSTDVAIRQNAVLGGVAGASNTAPFFFPGGGIGDFEHATWNGNFRRAQPRATSVLADAGNPSIPLFFNVPRDFFGATRQLPPDVGAFEERSFGRHYAASVPGPAGQLPEVGVNSLPTIGNGGFEVQLSDGPPNQTAFLLFGLCRLDLPVLSGHLLTLPLVLFPPAIPVDAGGQATMPLFLPNDSALIGVSLYFQWLAISDWTPEFLAYSDGLQVILHQTGALGGPLGFD